jgi:hypothetical protein
MRRDFFADEIPPTGKQVPADREVGSPVTRVIWLLVVAFIGFSATLTAMSFGPRAVEYVKEFSSPSPPVAKKSGGPPKSNPWNLPEFKPAWDTTKIQFYQPPSIPPLNLPQGNGISAPNSSGGGGLRGFRIHR